MRNTQPIWPWLHRKDQQTQLEGRGSFASLLLTEIVVGKDARVGMMRQSMKSRFFVTSGDQQAIGVRVFRTVWGSGCGIPRNEMNASHLQANSRKFGGAYKCRLRNGSGDSDSHNSRNRGMTSAAASKKNGSRLEAPTVQLGASIPRRSASNSRIPASTARSCVLADSSGAIKLKSGCERGNSSTSSRRRKLSRFSAACAMAWVRSGVSSINPRGRTGL